MKLCVYLTKLWISSVQSVEFTLKFPILLHQCTVLYYYDGAEGDITDQLTVLQRTEPPVGTEEEAEWVRKQDFKFWRNKKSLSLPGKNPRQQSSVFHSSRLHFASRRPAVVLFLQVFQTLEHLRCTRSYYSSDERRRRLVELQRGTVNVSQQLARLGRIQPNRDMQMRRHASFSLPCTSDISRVDSYAVQMKYTEIYVCVNSC
jgi:hypothetical protein